MKPLCFTPFLLLALAAASCAPTGAVKDQGADGNTGLTNSMAANNTNTGKLTGWQKGVDRAKKDIAAGDLKILYFGEFRTDGKELFDDKTGLPMVNEEGDDLPDGYIQEVRGYNRTMRDYVGAHPEIKKRRKAGGGDGE